MLRRGLGRGSSFDRDSEARARARSDGFGGGSLREPRMGSSKEGIAHSFDRRAGVVRCALATTGWVPDGLCAGGVVAAQADSVLSKHVLQIRLCRLCRLRGQNAGLGLTG